jgi:hypothetical protein
MCSADAALANDLCYHLVEIRCIGLPLGSFLLTEDCPLDGAHEGLDERMRRLTVSDNPDSKSQ